ncbi:hypothetical protein J4T77_04385 [Wolbachia endosymbiont of Drosophila innubila]|uniref:hypothetical protein n=1 Tax=Wolbachia TaxID=953 RepID=UPI001680FD92|nr:MULTISPECIES: hypothetical protein [Wolbachia]MBA8753160.1 hypothetical protein [Wolbachia pipientis]UID80991.1 hypothetical protein J4T77_04385 [Wolbachia endosymbiont of Drosophila innubila]
MPGPVNEEQTVTLISSTSISEDDKITPGILPTPALRTSTPKKNDENTALEALLEEEFKEKKNSNANSRDPLTLEIQVSPPSLEETKGEETHVDVPQNSTLSRSPSQETVFDDPDKTFTRLSRESSNKLSNVPSTSPPSYKTDDSEESLSLNSDVGGTTNKKTNRFLPRAKYSMQQKGFIIFTASAIILSISAALLYLQDKAKFIAFFTNSPKYITIPVIALAALLAIGPIFFATRQFIDTEEHSIQKKDADKILAEVLEHQPKDKAIKSVRLEYSNSTHSNFVLNAWEAKQGFTNIDEKVITRTNKIKSVINDRPIFTALFTGVVAANIAFPLGLLATHGVNGVQKFYQNPLTNNIGLSLLIGSGILALSIICLGVHYYRKINCTNLIYSEEEIDPKDVNGKFIEEIKRERTNVLGENHNKDAKRSSLTLEQVVVQSHNCKDIVYSVG